LHFLLVFLLLSACMTPPTIDADPLHLLLFTACDSPEERLLHDDF
jgi:hypothetical protein